MEIDNNRYKVYTWKNLMVLHWILNPGLVINELILGQRVPEVMLEDKTSDKPRHEQGVIPCPHCLTFHDSRIWSSQNGTAFRNWFGLYCPKCGNVIPCLINIVTLLILTVTFPLWIWFKKPVKEHWLKKQPERYKNNNPELVNQFTAKNWIQQGLGWGGIMYIFMVILLPLIFEEEITIKSILIGIPVWLAGGLLWGYIINKFSKSQNTQ